MYIIFFISLFIHEMSHIFIAKLLNVHIKNVKFKILGISAEIENESKVHNFKKILILIGGPISNLMIYICFKNLNFPYKEEIMYTNLFLFLFNILPIIPLDGGKILLYVLDFKLDTEKSIIVIVLVGKIILSLITVFYSMAILIVKNIEIFIIIIYLWYIFIKEEKIIKLYIKIKKNMESNTKIAKKYLQEL